MLWGGWKQHRGMEIKGYNYSSPTASSGAGITGWPANVHWSESAAVWLEVRGQHYEPCHFHFC